MDPPHEFMTSIGIFIFISVISINFYENIDKPVFVSVIVYNNL